MIFYNAARPPALRTSLRSAFAKVVVTEYKFWVDFQGLMYFDDPEAHRNPRNQIRDRKFIEKFYDSLRENDGEHAQQYKYVGQFWGERNYLRHSTAPIIYTAISDGKLEFSLGLTTIFDPKSLYLSSKGHFCHPFRNKHTTIPGIFSNSLASSLLPKLHEHSSRLYLRLQSGQLEIPVIE